MPFDVVPGQHYSNLDEGNLDSRKMTEDSFSLGTVVLIGRLRAQHICFWLYLFSLKVDLIIMETCGLFEGWFMWPSEIMGHL